MGNLRSLKQQTGSMLLEGLCAILIFSIGVLGLVGLQATANRQAADAKYRSEASLLANQLIGQMWVSDRTTAGWTANFITNFQTNGAGYNAWKTGIQSTLPQASGANIPTVVIAADAALPGAVTSTSVIATITIKWQLPGEATVHQYQTQAQIN